MTTNNIKPLTFAFLDAPTGYGKTTAIINLINSSPFEHWLVVTPFKTEVDRICENTSCVQPIGKKAKEILLLLADEKNVCCTHALFDLFTAETLELLKGYNLIIDEEPTVIKNLVGYGQKKNAECPSIIEQYGLQDYKLLMDCHLVSADVNGKLSWNENHEYNTKQYKKDGIFEDLRKRLELYDLYQYGKTIIQCTKRETWQEFKSILICSYRIQDSFLKYYCDLYNINTQYKHIEYGLIVDGYRPLKPHKLNLLYPVGLPVDIPCPCSKNWYQHNIKEKTKGTKKAVKLKYFFRKLIQELPKVDKGKYFWTCYKGYEEFFTYDRNISIRNWKPCNLKGTNELTDCCLVGYFVNRFADVDVKNFLSSKGIKVKERALALSELIQFVWRSNIRTKDEKKVTVFIPAQELLKDFKKWIKEDLDILYGADH